MQENYWSGFSHSCSTNRPCCGIIGATINGIGDESMKIAICDDRAECLAQLIQIADDYMARHKSAQLTLASFSDPYDLLESADEVGGYDIYILDIVMPGMTGIQLGMKLRNADHDGKIIYLTSSEEYAIDSFKVKAFDYIMKPISKEVFDKTMDEAIAALAVKRNKAAVVKTKDAVVRVKYEDILYVELNKRVLVYHVKGGKTVESTHIRSAFSEAVAELLTDRRFAPCGASMAVNLDHVNAVAMETVNFDDGESLLLSKKICRELRSAWNIYWTSQEG
jgi:DNA-binding LytR/AlgR family response regulator